MTESLFDFQMRLQGRALDMMARGVLIDAQHRQWLAEELDRAMHQRTAIIESILKRTLPRNKAGHPTLFRSPKQMAELFAEVGAKAGTNRKTGKDTYDDETLFAMAKKKPGLAMLFHAIMEFRTLGQMRSTFVEAKADPDGRMRASFNTAGPVTFRLASSKNAFGRGTNLQNVSTGDRGLTGIELPNLRRAIIPPPGHLLAEPDLAGADAQVVAWDAGDPVLKQMFREGVKIHAENAKMLFGGDAGPDGKKEPYYTATKRGVHATNYYAKANTVAGSLGITRHEADKFQKRWFDIHPWIKQWHERVKGELYATKQVSNKFGYRVVFFDRIDDTLVGDALAWICQGTVACVMNRAWDNVEENVPEFYVVLQEHDSLVGQPELSAWPDIKPRVLAEFRKVVVPYDDPLIIPPDLKTSTKSWGDMEKESWE